MRSGQHVIIDPTIFVENTIAHFLNEQDLPMWPLGGLHEASRRQPHPDGENSLRRCSADMVDANMSMRWSRRQISSDVFQAGVIRSFGLAAGGAESVSTSEAIRPALGEVGCA